MAILLSVALLLFGIVVLVLVHIWVVGRAFQMGFRENDVNNVTNRTNLGNTSMSRDDVEKLPCFAFKAKDQCSSPVDCCAVCLERFKSGEKCRLLPLCRHSFHAECVDGWLLRTPVCPICRARADNVTAIAISEDVVVNAIELSEGIAEGEETAQLNQEVVINAIELREGIDNLAEGEERAQLYQETVRISDGSMELSLGEGQENHDLCESSRELSERQETAQLSRGNDDLEGTEYCECSIDDNSNEVVEGRQTPPESDV